jgi:hypothetical protein
MYDNRFHKVLVLTANNTTTYVYSKYETVVTYQNIHLNIALYSVLLLSDNALCDPVPFDTPLIVSNT